MAIKTSCSCGKVIQAPDNLAGKSVKCPGCSKPVKVPGAAPASKSAATAKPAPAPAKPATASKPGAVAKPAVSAKAPAKPAAPKPAAVAKPAASFAAKKPVKDFDIEEMEVAARCPKCQVNISPTDVICTGCGTNLKTGMAMKKTEKGDEEASFSEILLYGGIILGVLLGIVMILYATFFSK